MSLRVHSIETFGTHEGPGIRMVVFLQGCHFRCAYCHNPDTWSIDAGSKVSTEDILSLLEKQKGYLRRGGLTVSGGEPLIQRAALTELFAQAQARGFHTALDTNGSILDEQTKKLLERTDLVLLDVKHIDPEQHVKLTGQRNHTVLEFAEYLESIGKPFWLRYVLVPGWTNQSRFLHEWAQHFQNYTSIQRVEILPFHTLGAYKYESLKIPNPLAGLKPPTSEEIHQAQEIFSEYFTQKKVSIR